MPSKAAKPLEIKLKKIYSTFEVNKRRMGRANAEPSGCDQVTEFRAL